MHWRFCIIPEMHGYPGAFPGTFVPETVLDERVGLLTTIQNAKPDLSGVDSVEFVLSKRLHVTHRV